MRILVSILLLLGALPAPARDLEHQTEGRLPSGRTFDVRVREAAYVRAPGEAEDDGSRWGIDGGFPETLCVEFELALDGSKVHVPKKLFQDLSHISKVTVGEEAGEVVVTFRGGDGSGSYLAVFRFRDKEIERFVHMGEAPDRVWERTLWHSGCPEDCGG